MGSQDGLLLATAAVDAYLASVTECSNIPTVGLGPQLEHLKQLYEAESAAAWALQASQEAGPYIAMMQVAQPPLYVPAWMLERHPRHAKSPADSALKLMELQLAYAGGVQAYLQAQADCQEACRGDNAPQHADLGAVDALHQQPKLSECSLSAADAEQEVPAAARTPSPAAAPPAAAAAAVPTSSSSKVATAAMLPAGPTAGRLWQVHDARSLHSYLVHCVLASVLLVAVVHLNEQQSGWGGLLLRRRLLLVLQQYGAPLFPAAAFLMSAYPAVSLWRHKHQPLCFMDASLEQSYASWFHAGRAASDAAFHVLCLLLVPALGSVVPAAGWAGWAAHLLLAGCMAGPGVVVASALALPRQRYAACREALLVSSQVSLRLALLLLQCRAAPGSAAGNGMGVSGAGAGGVPLVLVCLLHTLLLMCLQTRLCAALGPQLVHSAALLVVAGGQGTLVQAGMALGLGACLPLLLVHHWEAYARKAFLALHGTPSKALAK